MLRITVISLVVANLLLLGFQCSQPGVQPETKPAVAAVRDTGIPTIHLFSELMQDEGLMSGSRQCFTLGPFHSIEDRDETYARLQQVSARISERQTEALVEKGYWVYMPPYVSLLEANETLLSLQALGLKDVAIMYDGEWKNSISLGYFMRQENAQRRKKALEDRGFSPRMRIQRQAEPRYWLDYEQEPGSGLIALDMRNRPNDFMQRPVPCPEAEFLDADALASEDNGMDLDEPRAPAEEASVVSGQGEDQDAGNTAETEQDTSADEKGDAVTDDAGEPQTVEAADETADKAAETPVSPVEETGAGNAAETPADQQPGETTDVAVESATLEDPDNATGSGAEPDPAGVSDSTGEAVVEAPPKQAVGTGPEHMVSAEPEPPEATVTDQGAGNQAAGAGEEETDGGGETSTEGDPEGPVQAPVGDSTAPSTEEGTEKDSGNGTGDVR